MTRRVRELRASRDLEVWQRGYHEHVIRDEEELEAIRSYIASNPALWQYDQDNQQRLAERVRNTRRLLAERRKLSERQLDLIARLESEYRQRMP